MVDSLMGSANHAVNSLWFPFLCSRSFDKMFKTHIPLSTTLSLHQILVALLCQGGNICPVTGLYQTFLTRRSDPKILYSFIFVTLYSQSCQSHLAFVYFKLGRIIYPSKEVQNIELWTIIFCIQPIIRTVLFNLRIQITYNNY